MIKEKTCSKCKQGEPEVHFRPSFGKFGRCGIAYSWCLECLRERESTYRKKTGDSAVKKWRKNNAAKVKTYNRHAYSKNREERIEYSRNRWRTQRSVCAAIEHKSRCKLKLEVIGAYGGRCSCCGETEIDFLTIEHISHNGKEHRLRTGPGANMYRDLKKRGFPNDDITVFCWNCNMATRFGGVCPHKKYERINTTGAGAE